MRFGLFEILVYIGECVCKSFFPRYGFWTAFELTTNASGLVGSSNIFIIFS